MTCIYLRIYCLLIIMLNKSRIVWRINVMFTVDQMRIFKSGVHQLRFRS